MEIYKKYYSDMGGVRRRIVSDFGLSSGNVLEIGTGDGFFGVELAKKLVGGSVVGIDFVDLWIYNAKILSKECCVSDVFFPVVQNLWDCDFDKSSFDMVATFLALSNLAGDTIQLREVFCKIAYLLKPGAKFLICEATPEDAENAAQALGFCINSDLNYKYFSKEDILEGLANCGLVIEEMKFYSTGSVSFDRESFNAFIEEEIDFGRQDNLVSSDAESLFRKYSDEVSRIGVEIDSKITVFVGVKR